MKFFSGRFRFEPPVVVRRQFAGPGVLILASLIFVAGCSKSKPPVAQAPPPVADTNLAAVTMPGAPVSTPAPVEIAASPDGSPDLKALNQAYIGWIVQNRRRPQNLDEFFKLSGIQFPPPPAGKKYIIDQNGFINVANR